MSTSAKPGAPVVGFNHNVKYGPRVYHVQTEDSGLPHAHYITHLFVGGNIVSSLKTSYADKADDPELKNIVRSLMENQHKQMLKRLVSGEFNEMAERLAAPHYEPGVLADGSNQASYVNTEATAPGSASAQAGAGHSAHRPAAPASPRPAAPVAARPAAPAPAAAPKPAAPAPAAARPAAPIAPRPAAPPAARPPPPAQQQPVWQPSPPAASAPAPRAPGSPLPSVTRAPGGPARPPTPPRMTPVAPRPAAPPTPTPAAVRPAAAPPSLFTESPVEMPHDDLPTLFAEELISEKSLDEVILAFLSADLEPPK